ncbi:EVE domain-containing protein [Lentzea chajnantorensis]
MNDVQLVLQPRGRRELKGPENFELSIRRGVPLSGIAAELGADLPALEALYPDGIARLWGSTPAAPGRNNAKSVALRDRRAGDKVMFYAEKAFIAEATILHVFRNSAAARAVWGVDEDGATWEHMMALGDVEEYDTPVPAERILTPLGMSTPLRSITLVSAADHARISGAGAEPAEAPRHWLLQCNPEVWDVWSWWEDGTTDQVPWTVGRYHRDLRPGDDFAFWVSGPAAGVYAMGRLASAAYPTTEFDSFWKASRPSSAQVVDLRFNRYLFEAPITRHRLAPVEEFADSLIMRMPGGTNPFPLSSAEWDLLNALARHGRTSRPSSSEPVVTSRPVNAVPETTTAKNSGSGPRTVTFDEAKLIQQYGEYLGRELRCLTVRLPSGEQLVCDVFDEDVPMIIEAKKSASREHVRMAIGQLFDYRHHLRRDAVQAVLLPSRPSSSVVDLLWSLGIKLIYRDGDVFHGPE